MTRKALTILCVVLALCVCGAFVLNMYADKKEQEETRLYYEKMNEELLPIQDEMYQLRNELTELEAFYEKEKEGKATIQILFTSPMSVIYEEVLPVMEDYGYVGLIAISEEHFPGNVGCISENEAQILEEAGWQFCARFDGNSYERIQELAQTAGITLQSALYFPNGSYSEDLEIDDTVEYIIHHGESGRQLLTYTKEDKWYLGALGWFSVGVSDILEEVVEQGANIVYTIGPDGQDEMYEDGQFEKMLNRITGFESLVVTDLTSLNTTQGDEADEGFESGYQNRKLEIQDRLEELQKLEQEIYEKYRN